MEESLNLSMDISWHYVMWRTLREGPGDGDDQAGSGRSRPLGPPTKELPAAPGFSSWCISGGVRSIV